MLEAVPKAVAQATFAPMPDGLRCVDGVDAFACVLGAWVAVVFGVLDLDIDGNTVEAHAAKTIAGNVDDVVARLDSGAPTSPRACAACVIGHVLGFNATRTPNNNGKNSENLFHGANRAPNWS